MTHFLSVAMQSLPVNVLSARQHERRLREACLTWVFPVRCTLAPRAQAALRPCPSSGGGGLFKMKPPANAEGRLHLDLEKDTPQSELNREGRAGRSTSAGNGRWDSS